jgi:hypothetical protein
MRQKTLRAFEEWRLVPENWSMLMQRVAMGETLAEVCKGQGVPYSLVARQIAGTPALKAEYDGALQIWADSLAQETIGIVDGATAETVGVEKLRSETRLKLAGKLYRERYGEREPVQAVVNISLGDVAAEIRQLEERLSINVAPRAVESLPAPVRSEEII